MGELTTELCGLKSARSLARKQKARIGQRLCALRGLQAWPRTMPWMRVKSHVGERVLQSRALGRRGRAAGGLQLHRKRTISSG